MHETAATRSFAIPPVAVWALIGFGLYLLIGAGSLFLTAIVVDPILGAAGFPVEAGAVGLSIRNALHPIAWGALVAGASVPIGRRLIDGLRFSAAGWLFLAVGLVLAAGTWFLVEEFVRARFVYVDSDYVGFAILTWPALVAIALAGWAALAIPEGRGTTFLVLVVLAAIGLAVALLPSVAGAADGIEPGNVPLAVVFLGDVAYAIGVVVAVGRRGIGAAGS